MPCMLAMPQSMDKLDRFVNNSLKTFMFTKDQQKTLFMREKTSLTACKV